MPQPNHWSDTDALNLRQFLQSNPRFRRELANRLPKPTELQTLEARALSGERREGARDIIAAIDSMANMPDEVPETGPFIDTAKEDI